MKPDELDALFGSMPESTLQELIRRTALLHGWLYYHTHDSRRSDPGFPDTVLVKGTRVLYREVKAQKGRLSADQKKWGDALLAAGADWAVWRPYDWGTEAIIKELQK